jgi:hypothetical protein
VIAGRPWASATAAIRTGGAVARNGYVPERREIPIAWNVAGPRQAPETDIRIGLTRKRVDRPSRDRIIEAISASHSSWSGPIGAA